MEKNKADRREDTKRNQNSSTNPRKMGRSMYGQGGRNPMMNRGYHTQFFNCGGYSPYNNSYGGNRGGRFIPRGGGRFGGRSYYGNGNNRGGRGMNFQGRAPNPRGQNFNQQGRGPNNQFQNH